VHFDLEVCTPCHQDQYGTYIYGDDWKTRYGGSPGPHAVNPLPNGDADLWNKLLDFANYNDIIDGYGFTREYNEERSHNVMIKDHHDITRGKKETCMQCKSTKLAYYWDLRDSQGDIREHEILNSTTVQAGHMSYPVVIPAGTTVFMYTDRDAPYPNTHEVKVAVMLPDNGPIYASFAEYPGADYSDPTLTGYMLWSALYALTINEQPAGSPTIDSGNGCNHCHDPHKVNHDANGTTGFRLIRKSLLYAIEQNGINPTVDGSPTSFNGDTALSMDEGIALCAQCHVEYVCGNSPIDKIDRDFFSWAKAADLEDVYSFNFPGYDGPYTTEEMKYIQDWIHGTGGLSSPNAPGNGVTYVDPNPIQEELIKSQHPEAETYWNSRHYGNEASCFICHMPKVTKVYANGDPIPGSEFTSHWLASPNKYMDPEPAGAFAAEFGLLLSKGIISPCAECHGGNLSRMKDKAEAIQDGIYADALTVQTALVDSLRAIKAAKACAADPACTVDDPTLIEDAAELHRAAHVRWENLVVSENSMGFHNPSEVGNELTVALSKAQSAKQKAEEALGACVPEPEICDDGSDNDCDTYVDCDDSDCEGDPACPPLPCYSYEDRTSCRDAGCTWNNQAGTCENGDVCTPTEEPSELTCDDGLDNDCDGLTDCYDTYDCGAYPACEDCSSYTDRQSCQGAGCTWNNKAKTCSN
jgi:formate-dependent nitrite reductase cytochrome c552 subunit